MVKYLAYCISISTAKLARGIRCSNRFVKSRANQPRFMLGGISLSATCPFVLTFSGHKFTMFGDLPGDSLAARPYL